MLSLSLNLDLALLVQLAPYLAPVVLVITIRRRLRR